MSRPLARVLDHSERDAQARVADQPIGRDAAPLEEPPRVDVVAHDALEICARLGRRPVAGKSSTS
jgi:hypothetical protein